MARTIQRLKAFPAMIMPNSSSDISAKDPSARCADETMGPSDDVMGKGCAILIKCQHFVDEIYKSGSMDLGIGGPCGVSGDTGAGDPSLHPLVQHLNRDGAQDPAQPPAKPGLNRETEP
jgi:hypothetical protein